MRKLAFILSILICGTSLHAQTNSKKIEAKVNSVLDDWHKAAAEANFEDYFNLMTNDAVFIGTDPKENWQIEEFKAYAKPHFDKGKAWAFKAVERNIYIGEKKDIVWFDELLDTHMGICRGSGILKNSDGDWKIAHYVLSITIPNEDVAKVIEVKKDLDTKMLQQLKEEN